MNIEEKMIAELDEAEAKAWDALARYKFQMFGYWAAIWVHLNRISKAKRANPWKQLVTVARESDGLKCEHGYGLFQYCPHDGCIRHRR
jgi:hypothetical protein